MRDTNGRQGLFKQNHLCVITKETLCSVLRQSHGIQRPPLEFVKSQVPSAQNNPHSKVAYWGAHAGGDILIAFKGDSEV